jgi:hypothetical protein
MIPKAEEIQQFESKPRPLPVEPWVAAGISRLWQSMKKNIQISIDAGKQAQHRSVQSTPASVHNRS